MKKQAKAKQKDNKAIAVIPVRGKQLDPNSTALRTLGNIPLINWTIEAALGSQRVQDVIITTPDQEILSHVKKQYGPKVIALKRSPRLAMPNTFIEDTIFEVLEQYQNNRALPDIIVVLYVESPFRGPAHINSAIDVLEVFDTDTVVSVVADNSIFYQHKGSGLELLHKGQTLRLEREELYREVGHRHLVRRSFLEKKKQIVGGKVGHIILDRQASLSLHDDWDWELAEFLIEKQKLRLY